jgi:TctA family transporter
LEGAESVAREYFKEQYIMEIFIGICLTSYAVSLFAIIEIQLRKEKKKRAKYLAAQKILVEQFNVSRETQAR